MNKKLISPSLGAILASGKREGSLIKRAMLCRTGTFWGMNGQVTVTREMLEGMANKYKAEKLKPQNDNDLAPILVDHVRVAQNVMGRVLADGMEVGAWRGPDGVEYAGLFADLRVDDEDARQHVESGKFSQLSISFDEESLDFYEVSFVAVPAAPGSIILSNGGKKVNYQQKLALAKKKHSALQAAVKEQLQSRQVILSRIETNRGDLAKRAVALQKSLGLIEGTIKSGQIKARFQEFVRQGKMNPVELKALDFQGLSKLPASALQALETSYAGRTPSEDVVMHGQSSDDQPAEKALSPKEMREAIQLQRAGQKTTDLEKAVLKKEHELGILADGEEKPGDEDKKLGDDVVPPKDMDKGYSLGSEDWKACQDALTAAHGHIKACLEKIQGIGEDADKLSDADDEETKALGDDEDGSDLSGDDKDDEKLGDDDKENEDKKLGSDEDADKEKEGAE